MLAHTPWPRALLYAFPAFQLILPLLKLVRQEGLSLILVASGEPLSSVFSRAGGALTDGAVVGAVQIGCAFTSTQDSAPPARCVGATVGLAPERLILQDKGLRSEAVINIIQSARLP